MAQVLAGFITLVLGALVVFPTALLRTSNGSPLLTGIFLLGLVFMVSGPLLFWVLLPLLDYMQERDADEPEDEQDLS